MVKIAWLCCLLDRPENYKRLVKSHTDNNSDLIFAVSNEHSAYYDREDMYKIPHEICTVERYNRLWELVKNQGYTHFGFIGDDNEFTDGFNDALYSSLNALGREFSDKRYVIYPNDGIHGSNLCTHPIFTKEWCDTLGYFFPVGYMKHCYVDNYIMNLAIKAGRLVYINIELRHHNYFNKKYNCEMDSFQKSAYNNMNNDRIEFERLIKERLVADVNKILGIENIQH